MLDIGIDRDGCAIVDGLVSPDVLGPVARALDAAEAAVRAAPERKAGLRDLLRAVPQTAAVARDAGVRGVVERVLGKHAFVVRAILFDKTAESNWAVPWHQDTTIAVRERVETPGFGPWSTKAGVVHVQPPAGVLEGMLTVRVHIDPCGPGNAPLLVIPGTHRGGILGDAELERVLRSGAQPIACTGEPGSAVLMRPLTLHSSGRAEEPRHRRVIHLEFAAEPLPGGLEWARA